AERLAMTELLMRRGARDVATDFSGSSAGERAAAGSCGRKEAGAKDPGRQMMDLCASRLVTLILEPAPRPVHGFLCASPKFNTTSGAASSAPGFARAARRP